MPSLNTENAILSNAIKVDSSYNVGIGGAASGGFKLNVTGTSNFTGALTASAGSLIPSIIAIGSGNGNGIIQFSSSSNYVIGAGTDYGGMEVKVGGSQALLILNNGNVGINQANPTFRLDVNGTARVGALTGTSATFSSLVTISADSGGSALRLIGRAAADAGAVRFFANNNTTQNARIESNSSEFEINSISSLPITFKTNDTTRLTIAASTGAATFSSSVTAASFSVSNGSLSNNGFWGTLITAGSGSGFDFGLVRSNGEGIMGVPTGTNRITFSNYIETQGVKFPATQVASSDPNTLDDYEEGTWSPSLRGSGTAGSYSLSVSSANYTRIGDVVTIFCKFNVTVNSAGSGYAQIQGLPFNYIAQSTFSGVSNFNNYTFTNALTKYITIAAISSGSGGTLYFAEVISGSASVDSNVSGFTNGTFVSFSLTYKI
jgi:hypothetical protein